MCGARGQSITTLTYKKWHVRARQWINSIAVFNLVPHAGVMSGITIQTLCTAAAGFTVVILLKVIISNNIYKVQVYTFTAVGRLAYPKRLPEGLYSPH